MHLRKERAKVKERNPLPRRRLSQGRLQSSFVNSQSCWQGELYSVDPVAAEDVEKLSPQGFMFAANAFFQMVCIRCVFKLCGSLEWDTCI